MVHTGLTDALAASESQMLRRVQLLSEVVFETDADGCFVILNGSWRAGRGEGPAAGLGRCLPAYVAEEVSPLNDPGGSGSLAWVPARAEQSVIDAALACPGECIFIEMGRTGEVDAA